MNKAEIRATLEKQMQLLSERSEKCVSEHELAGLTNEMIKLAALLLSSGRTSQNRASHDGLSEPHNTLHST